MNEGLGVRFLAAFFAAAFLAGAFFAVLRLAAAFFGAAFFAVDFRAALVAGFLAADFLAADFFFAGIDALQRVVGRTEQHIVSARKKLNVPLWEARELSALFLWEALWEAVRVPSVKPFGHLRRRADA